MNMKFKIQYKKRPNGKPKKDWVPTFDNLLVLLEGLLKGEDDVLVALTRRWAID